MGNSQTLVNRLRSLLRQRCQLINLHKSQTLMPIEKMTTITEYIIKLIDLKINNIYSQMKRFENKVCFVTAST
jgi:hypothetical protein